jgi:hypothetical protein
MIGSFYLSQDWVSSDWDLLSCHKTKIMLLQKYQLRPSNSTADTAFCMLKNYKTIRAAPRRPLRLLLTGTFFFIMDRNGLYDIFILTLIKFYRVSISRHYTIRAEPHSVLWVIVVGFVQNECHFNTSKQLQLLFYGHPAQFFSFPLISYPSDRWVNILACECKRSRIDFTLWEIKRKLISPALVYLFKRQNVT